MGGSGALLAVKVVRLDCLRSCGRAPPAISAQEDTMLQANASILQLKVVLRGARAWCGDSFDPEAFDAAAINRSFHGGWIPAEAG